MNKAYSTHGAEGSLREDLTMTAENTHEVTERQIRTVVVDDCSDVRFLLSTIMELDGRFEIVGEANSAYDGMVLVGSVDPDLVLVDLQLGGRDGTWLIRELRSRNNDAALAVVTGSPAEHMHAAALEAGADSLHNKGSMTSTMADDLARIVARRASRASAA